MLTAIDGDLLRNGGGETFRIKIWDSTNGVIIYDNQIGAAATADPSTPVEEGSIVIHKK